jgi:hypothetical protein
LIFAAILSRASYAGNCGAFAARRYYVLTQTESICKVCVDRLRMARLA